LIDGQQKEGSQQARSDLEASRKEAFNSIENSGRT